MVKQKELVEDRLQAVVLTDSFESRFQPLASVKPRCLLPLANVPLIEYTLEFLAKAQVHEVYLFCTSHGEEVQQYINQSKWADNRAFTINVVLTLESHSTGDVMRDIDNRGIITGDFLLVQGDVVTNVDFAKAMAFHKQKRATDKDHILTMVLASASATHRTRSPDTGLFAIDKQSDRCIFYDPNIDSPVGIDPSLLEGVDEAVVRNDLIDCHIDICTPHVPQIYQDEFDYQYPRSDFLKRVLDSDLVKKTIYAYVVDEYAARVDSIDTYKSVSQDIMGRYAYPLVPELNSFDTTFNVELGQIYKEEKVVLAQSCTIGQLTMIGGLSQVGEGSQLERSVIGRNCTIGANVIIEDAYLFDGVTVEDGAVIKNTIIGSRATISESVVVESSVIGYNVAVTSSVSSKKLSATFIDGDDDEFECAELDDNLYEFKQDLAQATLYLHNLNMSDESVNSVSKRKRKHSRNRRMSTASMAEFSDEEDFEPEAIATVQRALDNNHDIDTAALELNTLRMSMNVSYHDVRLATVTAFLKKILEYIKTDTLSAAEATTKIFKQWSPLFKKQVFDADEQRDLLDILQNQLSVLDSAYNYIIFLHATKWLYELDVLEEESILEWWHQSPPKNDQETHVRSGVEKFVEWLEDAEEESDDE
ncbi:hypothetical protein DIURU_003839 [Diutina rugosa]|uniref:Translation initiation factor eIF2B subunit epsilon n=1 Tax=Diutina rugosa TaxID=5481 RepID=A0A642UJY3_DIURU|nr:uncharacterized protein DIURU_003839 [Diutina rugosa]KAA8900416.1 hypothetical protein DIURU_003839 [Diutina rugosa]